MSLIRELRYSLRALAKSPGFAAAAAATLALGIAANTVIFSLADAVLLRGGSLPVAAGLAAGAAGSFAASRLLTALLFGISPGNVTTLLAAGTVLAAVAAATSIAPAVRAARADPARALRAE